MSEFYILDPETAGNTDFPATVQEVPPSRRKVTVVFDVWLGDDIMEAYPCYLVTKRLWDMLATGGFTGASSGAIKSVKGDMWRQMCPRQSTPDVVWLKVTGKAGQDDFGVAPVPDDLLGTPVVIRKLVASQRVLALLKQFSIEHCKIGKYFPAAL